MQTVGALAVATQPHSHHVSRLRPAQVQSVARQIPADASSSAGEAQDLISACFGAGPPLPNTVSYNDTALLVLKAAAFGGPQAGDILADVRREGFEITALQTFVMEQVNASEFLEVYKVGGYCPGLFQPREACLVIGAREPEL